MARRSPRARLPRCSATPPSSPCTSERTWPPLLEVSELVARYGSVEALRGVSLEVRAGEQQMLAIARALMSRPRILLCDEPSLGLAPLVVHEIMRLLTMLRDAGTTILLVEQNARMALRAANRAYVLEAGRVALSGAGAKLLADDQLTMVYLGGRGEGKVPTA